AAVPAPFAPTAEEHEEDEDPTAEQEYSSLLAMKNPFRKEEEEFVRVEEPEPEEGEIEATVTFPEHKAVAEASARPFDTTGSAAPTRIGAASRKPGDAARELRAALETLRRMSGAA